MFGDNDITYELIKDLLNDFELEEIFELNDLSPEEILRILLEGGYIAEPEIILEKYERYEEDTY